jgi:hypothetical protein
MTEFAPVSSFNRKAMIGFVLSIFALLAFCVGLVPIPFTELICYPLAFLLGITALILGLISIRELRSDGKNGQPFAWFAAWAGGLTVLGMLCLMLAGVLIYPYASDVFQQLMRRVAP